MIKEKIQKLKKMLIKKTEDNNKKNIENLIVFIVLLIITIIAINIIWGDKNKDTKFQSQDNTYLHKQLAENDEVISTINENNEYNLEENLENILSKIAGVGDVKVLITYCETSEIIPMYNETYSSTLTEETDTEGRKQKNKPGRYEQRNNI